MSGHSATASGSPVARRIAEDLLEIGAVSFAPASPFTWASGLRSPIYCDNRLTISYPDIRLRIRDGFTTLLEERGIAPEAVVGTATAGIPHAAWLADVLGLPMAYVRSKPKAHGTGSRIEGRLASGTHAVVVEDLVSTGGSSTSVVAALESEGIRIVAVLAIFSYGLQQAEEAFSRIRVPLFTLTDVDALLAAARDRGDLSEERIESLRSWRSDPEGWSERHA